LRLNFLTILPRHQKISDLYALVRKASVARASLLVIRAAIFTELSLTLSHKEETLLTETGLAVNLSMDLVLRMKIS
jgi:hypothetical protein